MEAPPKGILKTTLRPDTPPDRMVETPDGRYYWGGKPIRVPDGSFSREDYPAGSTRTWVYFHAEAHYVLQGKAELTYWQGPLFTDEGKMTAETYDLYLIPGGTRVQYKVDPSGPYKHMCIVMPMFRPEPIEDTLGDKLKKVDDYVNKGKPEP